MAGWVTLKSSRVKELQADKNYGNLKLLQLSRYTRQLAREKSLFTASNNLEQTREINKEKALYNSRKTALQKEKSDINEILTIMSKYKSDNTYATIDKESNAILYSGTGDYNCCTDADGKLMVAYLYNDGYDNSASWHTEAPENLTIEIEEKVYLTKAQIESAEYIDDDNVYAITMDNNQDVEFENLDINSLKECTMVEIPQKLIDEGWTATNLASITDDTYSAFKSVVESIIDDITTEITEEQTNYSSAVDDIKTYYSDEAALNEEEITDEETANEQEKTDTEAQIQSISAELESIDSTADEMIKNSVIKLA